MTTCTTNTYLDVERELVGALAAISPDPLEIDAKVSELESQFGPAVYSQLLYLLCHLEFPPDAAKAHWKEVLEHRVTLSKKLEQPIDFRVAMLDYFVSVNQKIRNPKIIEIKIFQRTLDWALRDELTTLNNYRYFRSELDREIARAKRTKTPMSLAIFDVDHFKSYNDQSGHLAGDQVLKTVAQILRGEVRESDLVARYGGEEFVALLPDAPKPQAFKVADRIRRKVAEHDFPFGALQPGGRLTISGGLATYRADAEDATGLIEAADRALYLAKGSGRNRVVMAGAENRTCPRLDAEIAGVLQPVSCEERPFLTDNVSEQGMQFHTTSPLAEGAYFRFVLRIPDGGREVEGMAKAMRVTADESGGSYEVGAQIVELSNADGRALEGYLEAHRRASDGSRRQRARKGRRARG